MPSEFEFIEWIRQQARHEPDVLLGPGDDCAVVRPAEALQIVTSDTLTEFVDFELAQATPFQIGRKAMGVNLSDIAAMAGVPRFALVNIVTRPELGPDFLRELFRGFISMAREYSVAIIGGDTNSWSGGLVVSVTMIGVAAKPVLRSGAQVGDWVFVTGRCGGSLLGRHLEPRPRVREAQILQQAVTLHAMIDLSDGLAADLGHILRESRVGAVLSADTIPIHRDAFYRAEHTGRTPLDHALNDGEDFELIFTVSPEEGARLLASPPFEGLAKIGVILEEGYYLDTEQHREVLIPRGWQHEI